MLRSTLYAAGYPFFASTSIEPKKNGVCLFSRRPFVPDIHPELGPDHQHRVLSARFEELTIFGVYFPQRLAKAAVFDFFLAKTAAAESGPALIIGDFNTGLHRQDEDGATFKCCDRFQRMSESGYVDCWRSRNIGRREFSWFSHVGNGFRIDHAFADTVVNDRVESDHGPRELGITDHSALIVELVA